MEAVKSPSEGRVLLRNVSWETYERLIAEREERRVPRFHYDRGVMEIMSPSKRRESISRVAALLVEILVLEMDLDVESAGSTTFKREGKARGFEPDECFYFSENIERVRGKENLDLEAGDPPPDLVIEVDVTNPSLDKLGIYARLGVAEVWRFSGGAAEILVLRGEGYEAEDTSRALPLLTCDALIRFVNIGLTMTRSAWAREVREEVGRWKLERRRRSKSPLPNPKISPFLLLTIRLDVQSYVLSMEV
ncbi:MAG: Uma2 family endonuclease [Rubrobacteraceae bacterium]